MYYCDVRLNKMLSFLAKKPDIIMQKYGSLNIF